MNKLPALKFGLLVGALLTIPLIVLFFLGDAALGLPLAPFDLFEWLTRVLPGPLVTFGIDLMVDALRLIGLNVADTAKTAEQIMALGLFFVLGKSLPPFLVLLHKAIVCLAYNNPSFQFADCLSSFENSSVSERVQPVRCLK